LKSKPQHITGDEDLFDLIAEKVYSSITFDPALVRRSLVLKFTLFFLVISFSYASLFFLDKPLLFGMCFVLFGFSFLVFAFNFSHDLAHDAIFRSKRLNHLFFNLIYTLMGAHGTAWKERHIHEHHVAPNVDPYDPDLRILWIFRMSPASNYYPIHRYQHIYAPFVYAFYSIFWIFMKDVIVLYSEKGHSNENRFKNHLYFWTGKVFYLTYMLILPLYFSSQTFGIILLSFFSLHVIQSLYLAFTFLITHHVEGTAYPEPNASGKIQKSWVLNQIESSNDFYPFSKTANFIFGGFNNHIAHHLFPQVPHIYYPEISKVIYATLKEHGIDPCHTTYLGGIRSHLRWMKTLGNQKLLLN
jgi:linoleoyl-CoA desaturase